MPNSDLHVGLTSVLRTWKIPIITFIIRIIDDAHLGEGGGIGGVMTGESQRCLKNDIT